MHIFNEYGSLERDCPAEKLDLVIFNQCFQMFEKLVTDGADLAEIRALAGYYAGSINCAASETVLRRALAIRKAKREAEEAERAKTDQGTPRVTGS